MHHETPTSAPCPTRIKSACLGSASRAGGGAITLLIAVVGMVGCGGEPTPTPTVTSETVQATTVSSPETGLRRGEVEPVEAEDGSEYTLRLLKYQEGRPPDDEFYEPEARWVRVRMQVGYAKDADSALQGDASTFTLRDGKGQSFMPDGYAYQPSLGNYAFRVQPDDTVTGYLGFKLPNQTRIETLNFEDPFTGESREWKIQ